MYVPVEPFGEFAGTDWKEMPTRDVGHHLSGAGTAKILLLYSIYHV